MKKTNALAGGCVLALTLFIGTLSSDGAEQCARTLPAEPILCPGNYGGHLQGLATDGRHIYWSFTVTIVKTDLAGNILATQNAPDHQGDLCFKDGIVYVAVNRGRFNYHNGAVSEVHSYDAETLKPLKIWPLKDMPHGAGGMTWRGDKFFIVGGLPPSHNRNYVYEYSSDFKLVKRHILQTGFTIMGIQTAAYENGRFLFGINGGKGNPYGVIAVEDDFKTFKRYTGGGSVGILRFGDRYFTGKVGKDPSVKTGKLWHTGSIVYEGDYLSEKTLYIPQRNGGAVKLLFSGRDGSGWTDCGYKFNPNGFRPLSQCNAAFRPAGASGDIPAVKINDKDKIPPHDIAIGIRRAAQYDEEIAFCFEGTPESVRKDKHLGKILSTIRKAAENLGVKISE